MRYLVIIYIGGWLVGNGWLECFSRWSWLEIGFQRLDSESACCDLEFAILRLVGRLEIGISISTDI